MGGSQKKEWVTPQIEFHNNPLEDIIMASKAFIGEDDEFGFDPYGSKGGFDFYD